MRTIAFTLIKFASRSAFVLFDEFGLDVNISLFGLENASVFTVSLSATNFGNPSAPASPHNVIGGSNNFGTSTYKM